MRKWRPAQTDQPTDKVVEKMVGREGIEPSTIRLKVECSTAELPARRAGDSVKPMPREAARNIGGQGYGRKPLARAGIYLFCAYI